MKKLRKLLYGILAAGMFASCSNDELTGDGVPAMDKTGDGAYMALKIKMPSGENARSATMMDGGSSDGVEVGQDYENKVNNVLLIIARKSDNGIITAGVVESALKPLAQINSYQAVAKFSRTAIAEYYKNSGSANFSTEVNIYVFCNYTQELYDIIEDAEYGSTEWIDAVCNVTEAPTGASIDNNLNTGIWAKNGFLMNNAEPATRNLPETAAEWNNYKTEATAFDLSGWNNQGAINEVDNSTDRGAIKVERAVARFDFKDGSIETPEANTYKVIYVTDTATEKAECIVNVELTRMMLTNMSKQFYYVPRVSPLGLKTNWTYCGTETSSNYVVGPNYQKFARPDDLTGAEFAKYFNFPFFNAQGKVDNVESSQNRWYLTQINDVIGKEDNKDNYKDNSYHIWRYATENVIPSPSDNQTYDRTTIVVFKGRMKATDYALNSQNTRLAELAKYMNNVGGILKGNPSVDPIIFQFSGALYLSWEDVQAQVVNEAVEWHYELEGEGENAKTKIVVTNINRSNSLYTAVYGAGGMGSFTITGKDYAGNEVKLEYTDDLAAAEGTANAAWTAWDKGGRKEGALMNAMRAAVTKATFTIYQSSRDENDTPGYYCYYYYRNRHNDNGDNGVMGTMEFDVVRNNVYKLAVTSITKLGHPRLSDNDPDAPKPGTPDEADDVYLTVTCEVLPWTVRVNNIVF